MGLDVAARSALVAFRRDLHRSPELSGEERGTAEAVRQFLASTRPDRVVSGLGGEGVAFIYEGSESGPTLAFRAELDALPIEEVSESPDRSRIHGKAHLCGHDGHMAALAAVGFEFGGIPAATRPCGAAVPASGGNGRRRGGGGRRSEIRRTRAGFHVRLAQYAGPPAGTRGAESWARRLRLARAAGLVHGAHRARFDAGAGGVADAGAVAADAGTDRARRRWAARGRLPARHL